MSPRKESPDFNKAFRGDDTETPERTSSKSSDSQEPAPLSQRPDRRSPGKKNVTFYLRPSFQETVEELVKEVKSHVYETRGMEAVDQINKSQTVRGAVETVLDGFDSEDMRDHLISRILREDE